MLAEVIEVHSLARSGESVARQIPNPNGTVGDEQFYLNEVIQTKYFERLKILPCQDNFRAYFRHRQRGWPTVEHLDVVMIYHNATCIDEAKKILPVKPHAVLPSLTPDGRV
jgi:hypothetical protein